MPLDLPRRTLLAGTAAALALPACAGFNFFTSEYTASRAELEAQVRRRFPLQRGHGGLFTVQLSDPRLGLEPAANRVALTMRMNIASPFLGPGGVGGWLGISSALRYDPPALALRLDQPRAERVALDGLHGDDAARLQRIGAAVAQEVLQDQPLHVFRPEELTVGRRTYAIGDITVQADGITVQLR
ncbi:MAG: DUF1439 domain-containing protein [Xenophilus sp.]